MKKEMFKYMPNDQLKSFEEYKNHSKKPYNNLAPLNNFQNYIQNHYKGVNKTPYFSIDKRYTAKK